MTMMEIDLMADLRTTTGWEAYPIKIPQDASYPAIVYKEIGNTRNSESSLSGKELSNVIYEIVLVTSDSAEVIRKKDLIINRYQSLSGLMGNTNIFTSNIASSIPTYDNAQNNFEYNITVNFTVKQ